MTIFAKNGLVTVGQELFTIYKHWGENTIQPAKPLDNSIRDAASVVSKIYKIKMDTYFFYIGIYGYKLMVYNICICWIFSFLICMEYEEMHGLQLTETPEGVKNNILDCYKCFIKGI